MAAIKIPFDSLVLSAVVAELQPLVGAKVQKIIQPSEWEIVFALYKGAEVYLSISADPNYARAHLISKRPQPSGVPSLFCTALRARLDGSRLVAVRQVGFDRILHLEFEGPVGEHLLVAELMGKHSNVILIDGNLVIVHPMKTVGAGKSHRTVLPSRPYVSPPVAKSRSVLQAEPSEELKGMEGASPFLVQLLAASGETALAALRKTVQNSDFQPVFSPGHGAYPISVAPLGLEEFPRSSMSIALEQHFTAAETEGKVEHLRSTQLGQLERVLQSREFALSDLEQARQNAERAGHLQMVGDLILAFASTWSVDDHMDVMDYEGEALRIKMDPELSAVENAQKLFDKAKKAKRRGEVVVDQIARFKEEIAHLAAAKDRVQAATLLHELEQIAQEARERKWLHVQRVVAKDKEDRPFEGHRIRELIGPGGVKVLYGENAASNDYLTMRVAKPDDWWLHVRGSVSAHVVIPTGKHPEKVGREALMYAAKVAVSNSPSKHAGYVPVDYTLKKYVRKPRGAPAGTALYTHEKTLHVES